MNQLEPHSYTEIDEDVIGLPEHINKTNDGSNRMQKNDNGSPKTDDRSSRMQKTDDSSSRMQKTNDSSSRMQKTNDSSSRMQKTNDNSSRMHKTDDSSSRMHKTDDRSNRMNNQTVKSKPPKTELPVERTNFVQENPKVNCNKKVEHENSPRFSEDFPLLPGGVPLPDLRVPAEGKQEDFPALGKSVKPKEPQLQKQPTKSEIKENCIVKKGKEKGKSWTQQSGRANLSSKNDFPILQAREVNQNIADNKTNVKLSKPVTKPCSQPLKAPPGYDKKVNDRPSNTYACNGKGPPGLGASAVRRKDDAPPGFRNPSAETAESNIQERNKRLVVLLKIYLDDFNLQLFKTMSGEFRKNLRTASVYYSDISELLGDNLKYVFSELVALLPDEEKSEELLKLHQNAKILAKENEEKSVVIPCNMPKRAVWGSTLLPHNTCIAKEDEIRCVDCGLTLSREDAIQHMESHGEAFPSLPTAIQTKKFAPFKKVHQSQVKNPWTK